ncbi:MAG: hypothetical protein ACFFEA_13160 [Candidatus Thorarchaeota archaeon]
MDYRIALAVPSAFGANSSSYHADSFSIDQAFRTYIDVLSTCGAFVLVTEITDASDCPTRLAPYCMVVTELVSASIATNLRFGTTYGA